MVVSVDFVADISLKNMLQLHRANDALLTCLLTEAVVDGPSPGPKTPKIKSKNDVYFNLASSS